MPSLRLDGRPALWEATKQKSATPILDGGPVSLFGPLPADYDGFVLGMGDDSEQFKLGSGEAPNPMYVELMKSGDHQLQNGEAAILADRNSKMSAKLENALFDNFGREIGMYYGCRSDKDVDWYLKRTFERLKNTIAQYPKLTSINFTGAQIAEKITANLGTPLNSTSEAYVTKLAEYTQRVSNGLVKKRSATGIDWKEPLGGGKGVLQDAGLADEATEWNKAGSGSLFSVPKTEIRGEGICKVKSTAKDRDAANHVNSKELSYKVAESDQPKADSPEAPANAGSGGGGGAPSGGGENQPDEPQDEKLASATAEPESSVKIDGSGKPGALIEGEVPAATKENIKDAKGVLSKMKEAASSAVDAATKQVIGAKIDEEIIEVQSTLGTMIKQHKSHDEKAIRDGHAAFLLYGTQLRAKFQKMTQDHPENVSVYKAIWEACLERPDLLATSFAKQPRAWKNAFDKALQADQTCREACRLAGVSNCP
jgi:hypothetical protein